MHSEGQRLLGEYLAKRLKNDGLQQQRFAELAGFPKQTLSHIVRGRRKPTVEQIFAIENATAGEVPAVAWTQPPGDSAQVH